ncbi:MAG: universal stress protein [Chloroflexi bacterium]|nr:universal stress protein [Chloroflexota bacterium]
MFSNLLVPLDGSPAAEKALDLALDMARCYGGTVTLIQVQEDVLDGGTAAVVRATALATGSEAQANQILKQQCEAYLREVMQPRIESGVPMQMSVVRGKAAESVVEYANSHDVDLVVMATHGRTGLRRLAFGSVAEDVLRSASCPVVVIRPPDYQLNS